MQPVFLICGVPGSGKTWVSEQLHDTHNYVRHDDWIDSAKEKRLLIELLAKLVHSSDKPLLTECPFGERIMRSELEKKGLKVIPIFVVESPIVVARRYQQRENRPAPKAHLTRAMSIKNRAKEWNAFSGNTEEVLDHLRNYQSKA